VTCSAAEHQIYQDDTTHQRNSQMRRSRDTASVPPQALTRHRGSRSGLDRFSQWAFV